MASPTPDSAASALSYLAGGGEMGERMRALDWSRTAVGPLEAWPQSLRSAVSMLLPSRAQIVLFWGPEFTVFYNDAYRPVFGAKHPQVLGQPGREAWSEIWDSMLHALLDGVVRTGEAFWAADLLFTIQRHGFPEETYFDVSYDPVRDESGGVGGVFCIVTETTGRVVGERRLGLLKDLAARNADARCARDACVLAMQTLAAQSADVPFALAFLDGELQASTPGAQEQWRAAGAQQVRELALATSGAVAGKLVVGLNSLRPFDAQYQSFLDLVAGQIGSAVANAQAYETERKRAEALADLDRAKTAFFSNVSHEFRTPLTLMLGPIEELLADVDAPHRELLRVAQRNGERLLKLVNTLLDFARIEAGRAQAAYQGTDLAALTADLASNFRSACDKAGLRLQVRCAAPLEPAWVDREMWEKIVLNLLSNAFKFTLQGSIDVALDDADEHFRLTVADTGVGMPAGALDRVFERFHRIEGVQGRSHEGSGIGLALVQELVKLHGGSIAVDSTPGRGTVFTVRIPKGHAHLAHACIADAPKQATPSTRAHTYVAEALGWLPDAPALQVPARPAAGRVLLADDNADLRDYVTRLLSAIYDVEAVSDGVAALQAARRQRPDVIVADVMMPNLDGFELVRELRQDPELRMVPVLLLSARAGEEARVEGLSRGADDYLVKPFGARELQARVAALRQSDEIRRRALDALAHSHHALREADRRKNEFLATLSHELRNPLAPMRNALHLMRHHGGNAAAQAPAREIMERQLNHLVRLVDDLLEMSRITSGTLELRRASVELSFVVRNALETSEPAVHAGQHKLDVSLPGEPLWLEGDAVRLAQILSNLLNNAAKYTPEKGSIALSAARDGQGLVIRVRDNGIGIAPDGLARIFEMFSREGRGGERARGGLGIGLTLSRRLAELHGGTLEARSRGVGLGSEFILRLPLAPAPDRTAHEAERLDLQQPLRVLVVDDNRDSASSLGMVLTLLGAEVSLAHDGQCALAAYRTKAPAVVLLDLGLPDMDGFEVARAMRVLDVDNRPLIIAVSGWGQENDRRRAREAGIDHHIVKPADIDELRRLLVRGVPAQM